MERTTDCLFCRIVSGEIPAELVAQGEEWIAFRDVTPQAPTHVLIIPKTHIASVNELTDANSDVVGELVLRARAIAAERGHSEPGYRIVMNCNAEGGQTVFHLHLHLLGGRQLKGMA